ncbi:MAG: cellulase family glycosylhydrolase [Spirochaetales bacterium]|nr:cellulase family glycosylhydrolase [Spirochaetales bacterium]
MKKKVLFLFLLLCGALLFASPYHGSPAGIPGVIEAEDYDLGGEGSAYHDADSGNTTGAYRSDDVDIETNPGGYHVSYIASGEWLNYTVAVDAGNYYIDIYSASSADMRHAVSFEMDGVAISGAISLPTNGSWTEFVITTYGPVSLTGNEQVLRINMNGSDFNIDKVEFIPTTDEPTPSPPPTPTPTPTGTPAPTRQALHVDGKNIVDSSGNVFVIKGVGTQDIDLLVKGGRQTTVNFPDMYPRSLEEVLDLTWDWVGLNSIRLTFHANEDDWEIGAIGWDTYSNKEQFCTDVLDRSINYCINLGFYVIIDWHYFVGRGWTGDDETNVAKFWQKVAPRWAGHPNVIYEIFNEPGGGNWGTRGDSNDNDFVDFAERMVNAIRGGNWSHYGLSSSSGADNLALVGAPSYSQQLPNSGSPNASYDANLFLSSSNVAYVCHVYPQHGQPTWFEYTQKYRPVVLTEFGWELNGTAPTAGTTSGWGQPYKNWVQGFGNVGVVAWCWDNLYRSMMWSTGSKEQGIDWELLGSSANIAASRIAYGGAQNTYDNYMGQFVKDWYAEGQETLPPTEPPTPTPTPTATPEVTATPTPSPTPGTDLAGDVNEDMVVDIVDALLVAQYYVGLEPAAFTAPVETGDVDLDGNTDIIDALLIAQYYVGIITELPVQ